MSNTLKIFFLLNMKTYPMCQTVLQQRCSSAVPAVLPALLLHSMLKNAECSIAAVLHKCCVLRSMNGTWGSRAINFTLEFQFHDLFFTIK
jgi:hypothetical protein